MPIEGTLRELALVDLLQLIHLSRKSGVLRVRAPQAPAGAELHFDRGSVIRAASAQEVPRLGTLLLMAGKATDTQVERAVELQHQEPWRRLGPLLVEQGIPAVEVERQLRFQIEETVFDLVRWTEGDFRFEEVPVAADEPVAVRIGVELLLLDALRRIDEWGALASDRLDLALIPALVELGGDREAGALLDLHPGEWEVLAAVDGRSTLRGIGQALARSEIDVAKAIFSLIDKGLVELRPHEPAPVPAGGLARDLEAQVRADLQAGQTESAARRVGRLLSEDPHNAELHALRGEVEVARGRMDAAMESLETALRLDPLLPGAYYSLGFVALRAGDLVRSLEAFQTYLRLPDLPDERRRQAARAASLLEQIGRLLEEEHV